MEIEARHYLLSYHKQSWYGFWKAILDNPPCKKPGAPRNKQFSYELEAVYNHGSKHELYLHLIGPALDLDDVEKQLAKYKIARLEPASNPTHLVLIMDQIPDRGAMYIFYEFCRDKNFRIKGREIHKDGRVLKVSR